MELAPENVDNRSYRLIIGIAAAIVVIIWGLRIFYMDSEMQWMAFISVILVVLGILTIGMFLIKHQSRHCLSLGEWLLLGCALAGFAMWSYTQILYSPSYGTDELAFDQYAWYLLLHHVNPYTVSMAPAFSMYHVSPIGYTFTYDGIPVTKLSYPALSFLLYAPLWFLGVHTQNAVWTNVMFWAISLVIAFALVPKKFRSLSIIIFSLSFYVDGATGGITDALTTPFLLMSALLWDRFVHHPKKMWWAPVFLGLAMSVKQTPWLIAPLLLLAVILESRRAGFTQNRIIRVALSYVGLAFVAFLIPNIPFLIVNPAAWLHGTFTPLSSDIVASGQGIVALSIFTHLGGGALSLLTYAALLIYFGLMLVYWLNYGWLKPWTFFIPAIVYLLTPRSFSNYFLSLIPVVIFAFLNTERTSKVVPFINRSLFALIPGTGLLLWAFFVPGPLQVLITNIRTTGQFATVEKISLRITNLSAYPVTPHYTVDQGGQYTTFWNVLSGQGTIAPGRSTDVTLEAPNVPSMPPVTGGFQVVAFGNSPKTISESNSYVPSLWHIILMPESVDHAVPLSSPVTLTAQVVNRLNRPIRKVGIPVYLGQIIYAQSGLKYAETKINTGSIGQTPVKTLTNNQGQAIFTIRGSVVTADPVYYEANLVNSGLYYPYGYSNIVSVKFH